MNWTTSQYKVSNLQLDKLNPRLPRVSNEATTRDIVAALIAREDVLGLAKSIVDFGGLYPNERVIVIEESGERIVVEGNRRLAALKLLQSPDLAPDDYIERFRSLSNRIDPRAIERVDAVVVQNRAAAAKLIVARHTRDAVRRWTPSQQARYIRTLVRPGNTIEDVAEEIKVAPGEVRNFLATDTMLQLAATLDLAAEVREALESGENFSVSALQRLIESSAGRKFLGIAFDAEGNAVGHVDVGDFRRAFSRIVSDIAENKVDTRKLNRIEGIKGYLESIAKVKPNQRKNSTWTSIELLSGKTQAAQAAMKAAAKARVAPQSKDDPWLIPRSFRCRLDNVRIREVFGELRRMKRLNFPNASAVMLRIFAELVISHYLDETGKIKPLTDKAKRDGRPRDWYPTLTQMMAHVLKDENFDLKPMARRALNKMLSDDTSLLSLDHVNQFVHNRFAAPTDRELKLMWAKLEPMLVPMMDEPNG